MLHGVQCVYLDLVSVGKRITRICLMSQKYEYISTTQLFF